MEEPNVKDFLPSATTEEAIKTEEIKFKRFKAPFKIKSLMAGQTLELQKEATTKIFNEKTRIYDSRLDQEKLTSLYVTESVVTPNLNSAELQKAYGTIGDPYGTLTHMLTAGEFAALVNAVMKLSGLDESNQDVIETVKN
ncbi:phage portal protein [Lactobacillus hamsteri]|uniref:Phage XkdN-like protein n=1 Tax=Lactobacillus hamsteri DSM 5661 = JCM 6256 TaxID=1423754 RepID=A0A0R1Y3Y8_9LACO|nr:hypothetical protein [Lactobacillus hamsteri]KRM36999.1 hypothetical protein FC39_GL000451 [Lactobacillus hamsteri DSM 5661 = JCM 6256]